MMMNHTGINILTWNGYLAHKECTSSPEMGICLNGNGYVTHWEWVCDSLGIHILTGNTYPQRKCTYFIRGDNVALSLLLGETIHPLFRIGSIGSLQSTDRLKLMTRRVILLKYNI